MNKLTRIVAVALAYLVVTVSALAQNGGTATNHAFAIGKGVGQQGYTSLLCGSAQLAVGQAAADPICRTITGDVTLSAAGVTAIGANKVTNGMLATGTQDTALGYWGSTVASGLAIGNCANSLTYSTTTHTFGCNVSAGTGTVTSAAIVANAPLTSSGTCTITSSGTCTLGLLLPPGGRLVVEFNTCSGAQPIQLVDVVNAAVICYVPYVSGYIPINGTSIAFSTLTLSLNSTHQIGTFIYDIYAVNVSGSAVLCFDGTPWASNTARTDAITKTANAIWVNSGTISHCWNSSTDSGPISANAGTYLGSMYAVGNGATDWHISPQLAVGGTNNFLPLFNAYNQKSVTTVERDQGQSPNNNWLCPGLNGYQLMDASTFNRITTLDGLGTSQIRVTQFVTTSNGSGAATTAYTAAVCVDCTTPGNISQILNQNATGSGAGVGWGGSGVSFGLYPPFYDAGGGAITNIGLHYFQALDSCGPTNVTVYGGGFTGMFLTMDN